MHLYRQQISGVFQQQADALSALASMQTQGLHASQMRIDPSHSKHSADYHTGSQQVFNNMLLIGSFGAIVGVLLASLAEVLLIATHTPLLSAGLRITTFALLGSSATLGMTVGAAIGAMRRIHKVTISNPATKLDQYYSWIHRLIGQKPMKLSVETYSVKETALALNIMQTSVNFYHDELSLSSSMH